MRREPWDRRPFFDGTWVHVFSLPGVKCTWREIEPGLYEKLYETEEGYELTAVRTFETGATRDSIGGKLQYEGFLAPLVLRRYAEYMHEHRVQSDGQVRAPDNWQRGMAPEVWADSLIRHTIDFWILERQAAVGKAIEDLLCAILFNTMGFLNELLRARRYGIPDEHA